jgi:hypothetical protein
MYFVQLRIALQQRFWALLRGAPRGGTCCASPRTAQCAVAVALRRR